MSDAFKYANAIHYGSVKPPSEENEQKKQQRLMNQPIPIPPTQRQSKAKQMTGMWIGGKRNHVKVASQKRITKLINA